MKRDVARELRRLHGRVVIELDAAWPDGTGLTPLAPVTGTVALANVGGQIRATGAVRTVVRLACSRCLREFPYELEVPLDELCVLAQIDEPAAYAEQSEDTDVVPILNEEFIDLSELVRQCLVLGVPDRPLCREDCKGLCPQCGQDLNEKQCNCTKVTMDPRWLPLRRLLEQSDEED